MSVPKIVIVGRPNVGKSSLLNWIAQKKVSVVEPTAGVTRDRVSYLQQLEDRYAELVDTGGIGIVDKDDLSADIEKQINTGIEEASLILFVVDGVTGPVPLDHHVAERLRKIDKPILIVVNKCDSPKLDNTATEFLKFGNYPLICTSVLGNRNREELLADLLKYLPAPAKDESSDGQAMSEDPELKLAIVGRRNVGKSTFINALAETERMIVSEIAGTTRDSVDVRFELDGKRFVAIDTPGVRKKKSLENDIEFYGLVRAQKSIRRANVVLMFFDASQEISNVDKQLVEYIKDLDKTCIFVVNKWDRGQEMEMTTGLWSKYLLETFTLLRHVPVAFITAKESTNVKKVINLAQTIAKQSHIRVPTSRLNAVVRAAVLANRPPMRANKQPKIYYGTQVAVDPPTLVFKCNYPSLFDRPWQRYLLGVLREHLPFKEVPIKMYFRARTSAEAKASSLEEAPENDPRLLDGSFDEFGALPGPDDADFEEDDFEDDVENEDWMPVDWNAAEQASAGEVTGEAEDGNQNSAPPTDAAE